jgi:hypothetical protein
MWLNISVYQTTNSAAVHSSSISTRARRTQYFDAGTANEQRQQDGKAGRHKDKALRQEFFVQDDAEIAPALRRQQIGHVGAIRLIERRGHLAHIECERVIGQAGMTEQKRKHRIAVQQPILAVPIAGEQQHRQPA